MPIKCNEESVRNAEIKRVASSSVTALTLYLGRSRSQLKVLGSCCSESAEFIESGNVCAKNESNYVCLSYAIKQHFETKLRVIKINPPEKGTMNWQWTHKVSKWRGRKEWRKHQQNSIWWLNQTHFVRHIIIIEYLCLLLIQLLYQPHFFLSTSASIISLLAITIYFPFDGTNDITSCTPPIAIHRSKWSCWGGYRGSPRIDRHTRPACPCAYTSDTCNSICRWP